MHEQAFPPSDPRPPYRSVQPGAGARPNIRSTWPERAPYGQIPTAGSGFDRIDVPWRFLERPSPPVRRVIRPPNDLNPDNTIEPPDTGRTPVIPPPGSLGGDQQMDPK